jgi:hypothetical protein
MLGSPLKKVPGRRVRHEGRQPVLRPALAVLPEQRLPHQHGTAGALITLTQAGYVLGMLFLVSLGDRPEK